MNYFKIEVCFWCRSAGKNSSFAIILVWIFGQDAKMIFLDIGKITYISCGFIFDKEL